MGLIKLFSQVGRRGSLECATIGMVFISHVASWSKDPLQELTIMQCIKLHGIVELTDLTRIDLFRIGELVEQLLPTFNEFDGVELGPQRSQHLLPIAMRSQTSPRSVADAMLGIQLNIQRIKRMTTRRYGDADAVVERSFRVGVGAGGHLILRLVQLEANLGQVVKLGNGVSGNLGLNSTLEDAVEESVDVGFLGKVYERLCVVRGLH